jgi:phosphopantothenoylcysteine decarboxylase/phosphopantothenate--cysteine ligase
MFASLVHTESIVGITDIMALDDLLRPYQPLSGKRVLLGVTGGIAAYKAAELASTLVQLGADVRVLMTSSAQAFVGPSTFAALTLNPVHTDVLEQWQGDFTGHISLGQSADAFVIAPATANSIARLAAGLADDPVGTVALTSTAPLIIAPAMEHGMFHHPATQANIAILRERGVIIAGPDKGRLASGEYGDGRLIPVVDLVAIMRAAIGREGALAGRTVVVTAGSTYEPIDPVRFMGNRSSGRMGYSVAQAAMDAGADVTLISGPARLVPPAGATLIRVESARQMQEAVHAASANADAIVMTAAVSDYRPARQSEQKIKKSGDGAGLTVELVENPDIIGSLRDTRLVKIGFAAETNDHLTYGSRKLASKGLDLVVVNDAEATIGSPTSQATIISRDGGTESLPEMTKEHLAAILINRLASLLQSR